MRIATCLLGWIVGCMLVFPTWVAGQDWPQWRGPNRDARAVGFNAPSTWPKELTKKWTATVGEGVATPALVDVRLYVFSRQDGKEVLRMLDAENGYELWQNGYESEGADGPAAGFSGPRSSPTVVEGKVITLGVRGTVSCVNAESGETVWRRNDFPGAWPRFFTSSSPIVVGDLCIAQVGGQSEGSIVALDLNTGKTKWEWKGDGTAYASPVAFDAAGANAVIAETDKSIVAINVADGKLLWQTPYVVTGRGYNAATPIVDGSTIIYAGSSRGAKAVELQSEDTGWVAKELWSNAETSVQFNSPVLKNGFIYGISDRDSLFCVDAQSGKTAWTAPSGGRRGFGSVVDAGAVLLALTPNAQLMIFEPGDKEYKQIASYKISDNETYAYPVAAGNQIFVKDKDTVTLWTIE